MEISCMTKRPLSAYLVGYIASAAALSRTSLDRAAVCPGSSAPMIADNSMTVPSIRIGSPSVCKMTCAMPGTACCFGPLSEPVDGDLRDAAVSDSIAGNAAS